MSNKVFKYILDFQAQTDKFNRQVGGVNGMLKSVAVAAGVAFGTKELLEFGKELVMIGGEATGVRAAFNRIADDNALLRMKDAVHGTVSELDLMKRAVSASNLGIPVENLASLFEFATKRAQDTGESVDFLVNSIVTGIGRKSPLILDNLGITAVQLGEKLNGVGMEAASVAEVAKAVGEIAAESMKKSGEVIDTNAIKIQNIKSQWQDFKTSLSENKALIESIGDSLTKTQQMMFVWNSEYAKTVEKWAISVEIFDKRAESIYNAVKKREEEAQKASKAAADWAAEMSNEARNKEVENYYKRLEESQKQQIVTYGSIIAKIAEKNEALKNTDVTQTGTIRNIYAEIAALEKQKKAFEDLANVQRDDTSYQTIARKEVQSFEVAKIDTGELANMNSFLEKQADYVAYLQEPWLNYADVLKSAEMSSESLKSTLTELSLTGAETFGDLVNAAKGAALQFIKIKLAEAIASILGAEAAKGLPGLITGAVAATGVTMLFNSLIPSFQFGSHGEIGGNSFYGDRMLARVNSGEEIIRRDDPRHIRNVRSNNSGGVRDRLVFTKAVFKRDGLYLMMKEAEQDAYKIT